MIIVDKYFVYVNYLNKLIDYQIVFFDYFFILINF
jgi:hypothetical protein